jgi:hypothetical protein
MPSVRASVQPKHAIRMAAAIVARRGAADMCLAATAPATRARKASGTAYPRSHSRLIEECLSCQAA